MYGRYDEFFILEIRLALDLVGCGTMAPQGICLIFALPAFPHERIVRGKQIANSLTYQRIPKSISISYFHSQLHILAFQP